MTEPHVFDELPLLLSGEAGRDEVRSAAAHLRGCEDCRQELISAVVSHAALSSAVRVAPDLADRFPLLGVDEPAAAVELPDLSAVFAQIRAEATAPGAADEARRTRRVPTRWLVAAALVAALGVGGGVTAIVSNGGSPSSRSVALTAYDQGKTSGSARLIDDREMKLDAASLPALGGGEYYEVWLTDSARTSMAAVGQLDQNRKGVFVVPASVMSTYSAVEVSVQHTSTTGAYSGVSVLRGSYA